MKNYKIRKMNRSNKKLRQFFESYHDEDTLIHIIEPIEHKDYFNNKNGHRYIYYGQITDATNGQSDKYMVLYSDGDKLYAREANEFFNKFTE